MTTPPENVTTLQQRIQTLERMIAERDQTAQELHERLQFYQQEQQQTATRLSRFKELADSAIQTRSDFLANMSHKIRTPLNAVMAMTDLLLESDLAPQQQEFVEMIQAGGNSLIAMVNDILDFSRIESDQLQLEYQPFDLRTCVEESLDVLSPRAAEKQIDLIYNVDDQTPNVLIGDAGRLQQVLVHLLSNAIKFTDKGEVVVLITSRPMEAAESSGKARAPGSSGGPPQKLLITVRDTGIGMSQEMINTIFQPFSQADNTTTRKYGGSGLGLMICKRLVEMMGGDILVKSQVGKGTTLHVTIMAEEVPENEGAVIGEVGTQPTVPATASAPALIGKRVLIVDDNATSRSILSRRLHTWGMVPIAATSGPEAMEWVLRGETFHVALIDLHMPQMDGMTLAARMRLHLDAQTLPLVLITAFAGEVVRSSDVDIAAFLTRPIKPSNLYRILVTLLSEQTELTVALPQPERQPGSERKAEGADPRMAEQMPMRILLAEDNRINQKVALSLLKRLGYRADVATDGLEVLESLARQTYDIVLMDVQMPEMDGVQATQHIRRFLPPEKQPRIAAMTAHALQGDREHYLAQGMDDYVSKPVKLQDLVAVLSKAVQQRQLSPDEEADPGTAPLPEILPPIPTSTDLPQKESFPLDVTVLEQFLGEIRSLAPQLADELIDTLLQETPRTLHVMRQAVDASDAETLYNAAHGFKPHCTQFGAMTMMMLCQELETISRSGTLSGALERVEQLEQEYALVKEALETMRAKQ